MYPQSMRKQADLSLPIGPYDMHLSMRYCHSTRGSSNVIPQRIVLTGPGGVGKTTLAQTLNRKLGHPHVDLDDVFCRDIQNIREFIREKGYAAYARRNGQLLLEILSGTPRPVILSLSSGVLSHDMEAPMRSELVTAIATDAIVLLIVPHVSDEIAAQIVATRQVGRGYGLSYEPERLKYLRRIREYRQLGFSQCAVPEITPHSVEDVIKQISACP